MKSASFGPFLSTDTASCSTKTGSPTLTIGVLFWMAESMTVLALRKPSASLRPAAIAWAHAWSVSSVWTLTPAGGVATGPSDTLWSLPSSQSW